MMQFEPFPSRIKDLRQVLRRDTLRMLGTWTFTSCRMSRSLKIVFLVIFAWEYLWRIDLEDVGYILSLFFAQFGYDSFSVDSAKKREYT